MFPGLFVEYMIPAINDHKRRRTVFGLAMYIITVGLPMVVATYLSNLTVGIAVSVVWGQALLLSINNEVLNFELRADEDGDG